MTQDIKGSDSVHDIQREQMEAFHEGLWANPEQTAELPEDTARQVIGYLLDCACKSSRFATISYGRESLWKMPREWLLEKVEQIAQDVLDMQDYWEYLRLLEVYCCLDDDLSHKHALYGISSSDPEIHEAAEDFLANPQSYKETVCSHEDE